jgi:hypothetical protein
MDHPAFRRAIMRATLAALAVGVMAACGGTAQTGDASPTSTTPPITTTVPEPEETEAPATDQTSEPTEVPTEGPTETPTETELPDVPSVLVVNESGTDICNVYISPVDSEDWGDNWIGEPPIAPGETAFYELDEGLWDVKIEDCDGHIMHAVRDANIQYPYNLIVSEGGGPTAPVTITNAGQAPICQVYISPPIAQDWGDGWMDDGAIIEPGASQTFEVPMSYYDFRVTACDGLDLGVEYEVEIDGPLTLEMP